MHRNRERIELNLELLDIARPKKGRRHGRMRSDPSDGERNRRVASLTSEVDKTPRALFFIRVAVSVCVHRASIEPRVALTLPTEIFPGKQPSTERTVGEDAEAFGLGHRKELDLGRAFHEVVHRLNCDGLCEPSELREAD